MIISRLLLVCAGLAISTPVLPQTHGYPSRPVRIVVGFAPGGATDIAARAIAQRLAQSLNGSFIVDNRPGAAGNVGADIVAKANRDGHTVLVANSTIAIPSLFAKLPFDVRRDFSPVTLIALGPSVLSVNPGIAATDVKSLVALAKAKPGHLAYGSGGVGNITHLAMELFASMSGTAMTHVPYKGAAPSLVGLLSGEVQLLFSSIPAALPHVKAGRVRPLGVSIAQRSPVLPDVPTIAESGLPGYYAASWYGLLFPAGVPKGTVGVLAKHAAAAVGGPELSDQLMRQGFEPSGAGPAEFAKFIREEIARWDRVVKQAGIQPQ